MPFLTGLQPVLETIALMYLFYSFKVYNIYSYTVCFINFAATQSLSFLWLI